MDWFSLLPVTWQHHYLQQKLADNALADYLQTPLPDPQQSLADTEFLVLDFETTGLNPQCDEILSAGYILIKHERVILAQARHHVCRIRGQVPAASAAIHQISDSQMQQGMNLEALLALLLAQLKGRVLIAHHAQIEQQFLNAACRQCYGHSLPMRIIDTLKLEQKRLQHQQKTWKAAQLRLFNLRQHYGLPRYHAHHALEDAIATAELFLAQVNQNHAAGKQKIKYFLY